MAGIRGHLVAVLIVTCCLVETSDGDCMWQWSEWSSCNPGFFSNLLFKRDRRRIIMLAPILSRGERCDFSLSLDSPELVTFDGSGLVQSQPCSTRDTATYNGFCVDASMGRCANGFCISKQLFCDQDDDCDDRSDESNCTQGMRWCNGPDERRPSHNEWSLGVDLLSGDHRHRVLETGFNGECHSLTDGDQRMYRQPFNVLHVSSMVPPKEYITVKTFTDYGDFMRYVKNNVKHISQRASIGYTFLPTHKYKSLYVFARLAIVTEKVDMKYDSSLKPSKEIYMDLHNLPADMNNEVYMKFIAKYGTHFWSKAHRGGSLLIVMSFDRCVTDTAREHVELDFVKFLTEVDLPPTLQKRVTEYFRNMTQEYVHITGGHAPHNLMTGSGYSVKSMDSSDVREWKKSIEVSPQTLPSDAFESEEPVLTEITKILHKNLLTVRRWDRVKNNVETMIHKYLSLYNEAAFLCPECDGDDVIITPDVYYPAPSRFGCLCVTPDKRLLPVCYPKAAKSEESPGKSEIGLLDKSVIVALTLICVVLVIALVYLALFIRGNQKKHGFKRGFNPMRSKSGTPIYSFAEHKKLNIVPKAAHTKYSLAPPIRTMRGLDSFITPKPLWDANLEEDPIGDITFVDKTSEVQLACSYPYTNKVVLYTESGVLERDTESYNITLDVPQGIAYHSDAGKIAVCEWGSKCISILPTTLDAKYRTFVIPSRPWSVCPLVDSQLAISTCEKDAVSAIYIYTFTGVMHKKFKLDKNDHDRRCSMEEFGGDHLLVVNLDGQRSNTDVQNVKSPLKRTKSRNSKRKPSIPSDKNENQPADTKNCASPLIEAPVYATVQKKGISRGSTRSAAPATIPETQENHKDDNAGSMQLAVFDKNGQYQWKFFEPSDIRSELQVTSVCVSRLPISDPSWQFPEEADIQVLVTFASSNPSEMLKAFSPEGYPLDHVQFLFKYENSYGVLRSVAYKKGFVALLFEKHLAVYEGINMLQSAV